MTKLFLHFCQLFSSTISSPEITLESGQYGGSSPGNLPFTHHKTAFVPMEVLQNHWYKSCFKRLKTSSRFSMPLSIQLPVPRIKGPIIKFYIRMYFAVQDAHLCALSQS